MTEKELDAYYGLPSTVKFCRRCLMSNQKPHSVNETTHQKDSKKDTMDIGPGGPAGTDIHRVLFAVFLVSGFIHRMRFLVAHQATTAKFHRGWQSIVSVQFFFSH